MVQKRSKRGSSIRRRKSPLADEWDEFVNVAGAVIRQAVNQPSDVELAPYDQPESVLKRSVYSLVRSLRNRGVVKHLETAIFNDRYLDTGRTKRVRFEDNPFQWVLFGLADHVEISGKFHISQPKISRYSRQLLYADRHGVPTEYLIGFLYQSGNPSQISKKANDPAKFEQWYLQKADKQAIDVSESLTILNSQQLASE